jgi:site-specific recombinase XerD
MSKKKLPPGITPRGNRWRIDTFYKGVRIRETCATPEMAETNLRKIQTLIDEGRYLEKKREAKETLGQIRDRYVEWCKGIKQKTVDDKEDHLNNILEFFGVDTLIGKVTKADVERFHAHLGSVNAQHKKTPLAVATINRRMACLKHFLHKAEEWGLIAENPARCTKLHKENNRRLRFLTIEECKILLGSCPSLTLNQIIELALNTGMRKSELLRLERDHANLRQGFLEILNQKNGEYDTIPLNKRAIEILRSIPRRLDSKYVFPGKKPGKPFKDLKRQFEKAVTKAKLEGVTFHTLRHTAASYLVMAGVDLATVKEILRHKSISMTLRYAHLSPKHKQSAVEALGKALTAEPEKADKTA